MPPVREILAAVHKPRAYFSLFRALRDDIDDTAHRLRAIQRTRRTLDDFDLLDIIHIDAIERIRIPQP